MGRETERDSDPSSNVLARPELAGLQLDVYDGSDGWWNPEHDVVVPPEDWEFLATGDAFITRRVKAAGVFWLAWQPRSRTRRHRRLLGLWAPAATIADAQLAAEQTATARAAKREAGARSRAGQEVRYQDELTNAVVSYLDFAPQHHELALRIARDASIRAAEVGSGRVGRTRLRPLEERAALAARAEIRHAHTDYHQRLDDAAIAEFSLPVDDEAYRRIKAQAHADVDAFLARHRGRAD